ncbi:MAG: hypothetical protein A2X82_09055 [Geobacteraceae bacterium GWC2_55_20]|nr:MAG: hypothetical protein A2X82_09055 [Geobacteraceae bacterium GWC2_55_20]
MDRNRITVDGSLALQTRVRMGFQGLIIKIYIALATAVLFVSVAVYFRQPVSVPFELAPDVKIGAKWSVQNFLYKNGFSLIVSAPEFVNVPGISEAEQVLLRSELSKAELLYWHQYYLYLYAAVIGFLGGLAGIIYMSRQEAKRRSEDQYIRGAQIISASDLDKRTRKEDGKFTAGKVHFPKRAEILPTIAVGRPQQGKSTVIKSCIDQHRNENVGRHIILDTKLDFLSSHFRPGDLLFAPAVDGRTVRWNIFSDVVSPSQIPSISAALIPENKSDSIWPIAARLILEGVIIHCLQNNKRSNKQLYEICTLPVADLYKILKETEGAEQGAGILSNPETPTAFSAYFNVQAYLRPLAILARLDGDFSIRKWLKESKNDLFLVASPDVLPAIKPLLTLFLSTLLEAHKGLPDDRERRLWYILDELAVLPKIPGLSAALNFGPSKGLCATIGVQSYQQLDEIYGRPDRESIVSSAGSHIFFSVGSPAMADEASKIIGSAEYLENRQTLSIGVQDNRDGGSSMDQISNRSVVTADEIRDLQPLNAYLKILGHPAAKIKLDYIQYSTAGGIEPDPQFELEFWLQNQGPTPVDQALPPAAVPVEPVSPAIPPAVETGQQKKKIF